MTKIDLNGLCILITGASQGIGKACAEYCMEMGAQVAIHYNSNKSSAQNLANKFNNGSEIFKANLENEQEVIQLFKDVTDTYSRVDVIILNAGVFLKHSTDLKTEDWLKTWKKTMDINLNAVGILSKLGIEHFKKYNGGRFIYIASRAVFRGETEEYLAYAASKGGITSLARSVARSFGKQNIKSFVIAPGFTKTAMAEQFIEQYGEQRILDELSLDELTQPLDLAPLIALMCSGLMDHATGATIDVNAGSHIR